MRKIIIQHKKATQITQCIKTNSVPLQVICDDGEIYYAKTMFKKAPPYEDVINEILCNYLLECWQIKTAPPCIIQIPQSVYNSFIDEGNHADERYNSLNFENTLFFGVKKVNATEIELYSLSIKDKSEYSMYANPTDLLKIGIFDDWMGNKDRRPENPNILLTAENGKFNFLPIDHTQAFGYQYNYKALNIAIMDVIRANSILSTPISKSIIDYNRSNIIANFEDEITKCISDSLENINFIFEQIPSCFGLSRGGKKRIAEILSDSKRNSVISKSILNFL